MKVQALQDFYDKEHDLNLVKKGTTFTVSEKRAQTLKSLGVVKEVAQASKKPDKEVGKGGDPTSPDKAPG